MRPRHGGLNPQGKRKEGTEAAVERALRSRPWPTPAGRKLFPGQTRWRNGAPPNPVGEVILAARRGRPIFQPSTVDHWVELEFQNLLRAWLPRGRSGHRLLREPAFPHPTPPAI